MRYAIRTRHRYLEVRPECSQLTQRVIKIRCISKITDEQPNTKATGRDQVYTHGQYNELSGASKKTIYRNKNIICNSGRFRCGVIQLIDFFKSFPEIISSVKS